MIPPLLANAAWGLSAVGSARRFRAAQSRVAAVQEKLLLTMIRANVDTRFGREHNFAGLRTVADFQRQLPLRDYDDFRPYIDRIGAGETGVLTREPVKLLEPTSGSTAATKLIPVTAELKRQFNRGISPWIADLFAQWPQLMAGPAYWSVSPIDSRRRTTAGGIPIGFEDDTDYLARGGRWLTNVLAVPPAVKWLADMDSFRYVTLLFLLRTPQLRLISVWNPTFLTILLHYLERWGESLVRDISAGTLTSPGEIDPAVHGGFQRSDKKRFAADPRRAAVVARALEQPAAARGEHLWPRLGLISCWTDGAARRAAVDLSALLPHTRMQGKGLIATEAFVSFPLAGRSGSVLAIRSHFLEFISDSGDIHLAHELRQGEQYRVVVTTGGGLYRYQLHDLVESLGGLNIRFVGRSGVIADLFGEKISEGHVRQVLAGIFETPPLFTILSPEMAGAGGPAYTLFTTAPADVSALEARLGENYHYAYCRRLGQLGHARVIHVGPDASERYLRACLARGQRLGDIKPAVLDRNGGLWPYMVG